MSAKHDVEGEGAKTRDHTHPRHHFWTHAHTDWRVWIAVVVMIALIGVYVVTNNLSLRPTKSGHPTTPAPTVP